MALNLSQKTRGLLGLDISSSAVKMVELSAVGRGGFRVERYAIEQLPRDAVVEGNIADPDAIQTAVRAAWKRMGTSTRQVAMALPSPAVISKKITVPAGLRDDELVSLVESEASQHIPFSIDEVSLDFKVLGPVPMNAEEEEVLVVATKRDRVEDRVAVAEAVGLTVTVMDVESYAMLAASELVLEQISGLRDGSVVAVADVGMNMLRFSVLKNNAPIYSREQAFGGHQLTLDIARTFGMGYSDAESGKRNGTLPEDYANNLLPQFSDNLALEVARSLQFFFTTTQYSGVDRIVLAGGCAAIEGIADLVAGRTQVGTVVANPFAGMSISDKLRSSALQNDASALLNACGLALRGFDDAGRGDGVRINLLPYREERLKTQRQQFYVSAGISAAVGAVIVAGGMFFNDMMLTTQQEANQRLETEIGESKKLIEEIKTVREQSNALLGRKNAIEGLQKNRGDIVHLLNELVARIPSGIYLTSLRQNGSRISVNGYAQSNSRVSELMRNIVASPWMGDPRLLEIKASAVGGRRQNSFSLEFSLIEADPQVVAKAEAALAEAPPDDEMLVAPPTEVSSAGESAAETPPASASSTEGVAQ